MAFHGVVTAKPTQPIGITMHVGYFTVGYTDFDLNPQGVKEFMVKSLAP
jgi:hypothetical protein